MKKFITLLILLCTVIGAKAATIVQVSSGVYKLTLQSTDGSELNDVSSILNSNSVKELRIEGTIYSSHFQKLRDFGNLRPTTLDLSNATLLQPNLTCTYKDDNGNSRTVTYSSAENSFPPIIEYNNVEYKLNYAITDKVSEYQLPSSWKQCLTNLKLPTTNFKIVNEDFCSGFSSLSNVIIPANVKVIGKNAFRDCVSLNSVDLKNVEFLCEWCFYDAAMPQITIPGTCVYIGSYAFTDQQNEGVVTTLVFNKPPANDPNPDPNHYMIIKQEAFNNMKNLRDVYINSTSKYICENWAFSRELTFGQGDPEANLCSLHFSSEVA